MTLFTRPALHHGYRSGHLDTCYLISSTFSHAAALRLLTDTEAGRKSHCISFGSYQSSETGVFIKVFSLFRRTAAQQRGRGGRLWRLRAERPALSRGCSPALQATASASPELPDQGSMFPGIKGICDDNPNLFNQQPRYFL